MPAGPAPERSEEATVVRVADELDHDPLANFPRHSTDLLRAGWWFWTCQTRGSWTQPGSESRCARINAPRTIVLTWSLREPQGQCYASYA
jgi:hypothetical protein